MDYLKALLSIVAGIIFALIGPGLLISSRGIAHEKATGIAVVGGAFLEAFLSWRFWALAVVFSAVLWAASRIKLKLFRVLLFWTPTLLVIGIGASILVLLIYVRFFAGRS